MENSEVIAHLSHVMAEFRQRALDAEHELSHASHDLDAFSTENLYLRRVIGHLAGIPTPKRGEVDPWEGSFSMDALGMKEPHETDEKNEDGTFTGITGPPIHEGEHDASHA